MYMVTWYILLLDPPPSFFPIQLGSFERKGKKTLEEAEDKEGPENAPAEPSTEKPQATDTHL